MLLLLLRVLHGRACVRACERDRVRGEERGEARYMRRGFYGNVVRWSKEVLEGVISSARAKQAPTRRMLMLPRQMRFFFSLFFSPHLAASL